MLANVTLATMAGWGIGHLLVAGLFLAFVGLGLLAARPGGASPRGSRRVNVYIGYILLLSFGAGLSQREAWPFSTWPLIAGRVANPVVQPRVLATDAGGKEHAIDYRAYLPFEFAELTAWEEQNFFDLEPMQQQQACDYLLGRIEHARQRWIRGHVPQRGPLGPFGSPYFLSHPPIWSDPAKLPRTPLVGLRFYEEEWDVEVRRVNANAYRRTLRYECRVS